jgi:Uncharacterized protein conserved in bacteria
MKTRILIAVAILSLWGQTVCSQKKLYPNTFPLSDVTLLDGPLKHAQDLNVTTLLKYNTDRLLAPYRTVAGLTAKAVKYPNWESDGLDGHIGGHYLSALAISYASTGNAECKSRMDYMVAELKACQDANATLYPAWGVGYAGAVPSSSTLWPSIKSGNISAIWGAWVPWYNLHKTYAGLRDAWVYGGNEDAKTVFLKFCDWAINLTVGLTDAQMEDMLGNEHGGVNETLADAYQMTGQAKYLTAARRFSHKVLFNSMAADVDNLDNMHANTQVPKAVGFERIGEVSGDKSYLEAGRFFWETVTGKRSLALGGNSRYEIFPAAAACMDYIDRAEGPESCNTNNMLKLTEDLFRKQQLAKYADYYERALFNHILSTQHPDHGGYVYFTPARPRHYRVYSAPEQAMWCCVGTGMENHGKYGEFIYTHQNDSLFLNLFIPSTLNWADKSVKLKQETTFPYEEKTKVTITEASAVSFSLLIRYPSWVKAGALKVVVNGDTLSYTAQPSSYINVRRTWNSGDVVEVILPMHNSVEQLINVPSYVAFLHGPILLGAKTGTQDLSGLVADASRWAHIAGGTHQAVTEAPILVDDHRATLADKLVPVEGKPFTFKFAGVDNPLFGADTLELQPFFKIHDARYMMYWMNPTKAGYQAVVDSLAAIEAAKLLLQSRTVDFVQPGQQQPESDHAILSSNSYTGTHMNESWRDARDGGYFSYALNTKNETNLSLMVRYWGNEGGNRSFDILVDDVKLVTENIVGKWGVNDFRNVEYTIPNSMVQGKSKIRVKFQAPAGAVAGGVFYVRLLRNSTSDVKSTTVDKKEAVIKGLNGQIAISGLNGKARMNIFDLSGRQVKSTNVTGPDCSVAISSGTYIVNLINDSFASLSRIVRVD